MGYEGIGEAVSSDGAYVSELHIISKEGKEIAYLR